MHPQRPSFADLSIVLLLFFFFLFIAPISTKRSRRKDPPETDVEFNYLNEEPLRRADVFFLVDQSNSIWQSNFLRQLLFVQETVQRFELGPLSTRVALATYGENVHIRFQFDDYFEPQRLAKAIGKVQRPNAEYTRLALGLRGFSKALYNNKSLCGLPSFLLELNNQRRAKRRRNREKEKVLARSRRATNKNPLLVVVVLGDGDYTDVEEVRSLVRCFRTKRVFVFSVGIGRHSNAKKMDAIASHPRSQFRINIRYNDPPVTLQNPISDCKPGKIWEFMIKHRAMPDECLPFRKRIQLNFVFDIKSKNSWRYPILMLIAEDMFVRMIKKYQTINRKGDFVRIRFHPRTYGVETNIKALEPETWEENDQTRYEKILEESEKLRSEKKLKKDDDFLENLPRLEKSSWRRLNNVLNKLVNQIESPPSIQHVIIFLTDRPITILNKIDQRVESNKYANMSRKIASKRSFELFGLALGGFFDPDRTSRFLNYYRANPHTRLLMIEQINDQYLETMKNFEDLFCNVKKDTIEGKKIKIKPDKKKRRRKTKHRMRKKKLG